jgi:hypothetical protein
MLKSLFGLSDHLEECSLIQLCTREGYPDGGPIGGLFAFIALFWTGLFAGAVSAALSILSKRITAARVRPILVRLGCAAFIYLLYATWKPFHELISGIAIG